VAEAEAAGGSPRKKPRGPAPRKKFRGEETFLLRLDQAKATAKRGRTEPIGLEDPQGDPQGDPDDWTETGGLSEGGRPKKVPPRTTKPPPVTQEDAGASELDSEEEEFDEDDNDDDGLERRSVVHERADGGRPKEGSLDAARDEVTRASIPDRPRGTTCDGGEDDRTNDDDEELDAARDEARRRPLSARTRGTYSTVETGGLQGDLWSPSSKRHSKKHSWLSPIVQNRRSNPTGRQDLTHIAVARRCLSPPFASAQASLLLASVGAAARRLREWQRRRDDEGRTMQQSASVMMKAVVARKEGSVCVTRKAAAARQ
jgi:hypothetical protein